MNRLLGFCNFILLPVDLYYHCEYYKEEYFVVYRLSHGTNICMLGVCVEGVVSKSASLSAGGFYKLLPLQTNQFKMALNVTDPPKRLRTESGGGCRGLVQ